MRVKCITAEIMTHTPDLRFEFITLVKTGYARQNIFVYDCLCVKRAIQYSIHQRERKARVIAWNGFSRGRVRVRPRGGLLGRNALVLLS